MFSKLNREADLCQKPTDGSSYQNVEIWNYDEFRVRCYFCFLRKASGKGYIFFKNVLQKKDEGIKLGG